jgi:hypothetical protein
MPNMEYKVDTNDKDTSPSPSPGSAQALTFTPPPAYSATPADSTQVAFTLVHAEGNSSHGYVPGLAQNHRSTLKSTTNGTTKHGRREDVTLTGEYTILHLDQQLTSFDTRPTFTTRLQFQWTW